MIAKTLLCISLLSTTVYAAGGVTGDWAGLRSHLAEKGIEVEPQLILDDTWNLHGGKKTSPWTGEYEYLFDFAVTFKSDPWLNYSGGTLRAEFLSRNWKQPSKYVGSYVDVDNIEAEPFAALFTLYYKQEFGNHFWFLAGKSDAYYDLKFTYAEHAQVLVNAGYTGLPSILFLPTYPDSAMGVVAGFSTENLSLKLGIYDGSLAKGVHTGKLGVFGHFFDDLPDRAFLIGELDFIWNKKCNYKGTLGLGAWKNTSTFHKFSGGTKKGSAGPYLTFDQSLYKGSSAECGFFFLFGSADPSVSDVKDYYGVGFTATGSFLAQEDVFSIGMSRVDFTGKKAAGFTKPYEASYEICYLWNFSKHAYLEPDFQYVVHPGGKNLPNASVFTMRLLINL